MGGGSCSQEHDPLLKRRVFQPRQEVGLHPPRVTTVRDAADPDEVDGEGRPAPTKTCHALADPRDQIHAPDRNPPGAPGTPVSAGRVEEMLERRRTIIPQRVDVFDRMLDRRLATREKIVNGQQSGSAWATSRPPRGPARPTASQKRSSARLFRRSSPA